MDKIVEAILKLQPFGKLFKKLGLNDDWSALFSVILIVITATLISKLFTLLFKRYKSQKEAIEDIKPQFDHLSIKKARQFYIQTQYQNASPAREEEPGFVHKYIARNKLIPFFIKTAFNEKVDSERFYLILADSGMGKTTFMINLYLRYNSFFTYFRNYEMKLFRFSNPDTITQVKSIEAEDAKKTILLLDALDEDQGIISSDPNISDAKAFQNRIDEIIEVTKNFREVIITCRTQYFPGQEEDPYELKIKRPDEKGFYILNKIYISPFNEKEVKRYLNKKFGIIPFINRKKKKRALKIISKSKNLVMRPMLLSYIDYLIQDEVTNDTTTNIYETLVSKWLQREAEKRKGLADRATFIENLKMLSFKTAIAIYSNWRKEGRMHISKEEALMIAKEFEIELKPEEITGQSLLTCDGVGNWKFAHKSILEFFLAKEAVRNPKFLTDMNFKGMDMAKKFYNELHPRLILIDHVLKEANTNQSKLPHFYIYDTPITSHELDELTAPSHWMPAFEANLFPRLLFKQSINFCNEINSRYGYSPVYDNDFNLLDTNGNITKDITNVRGFRLPTGVELQKYFQTESTYEDFQGQRMRKGMTAQSSPTGFKLKFDNIKNDDKIIAHYYEEWCHYEKGIYVAGWPEIHFSASTSDNTQTITNNIVIKPVQQIKDEVFHFRLVFVP